VRGGDHEPTTEQPAIDAARVDATRRIRPKHRWAAVGPATDEREQPVKRGPGDAAYDAQGILSDDNLHALQRWPDYDTGPSCRQLEHVFRAPLREQAC
jgi:hypothetical protein